MFNRGKRCSIGVTVCYEDDVLYIAKMYGFSGEYRSVPDSTRMKTELQGSSRRLQQAETTSPNDGYQIRETLSPAAERQESRESTSNKKVSKETISPTDQRQAAKSLSPTDNPQTRTEAASELRPSSSRGSVSGGACARPAQGLVMSTLDNSGRGGPRGYQPSFSGKYPLTNPGQSTRSSSCIVPIYL